MPEITKTPPALSEHDLVDLWEALDEIPEPPCEATERRHARKDCAGSATHRLQTCAESLLVCDVVAARVREHMDGGSRCDQHREPIASAWRLIPV